MKIPDTALINKLLEIGIALSKEKDVDALLEQILFAAMDITNCDGGTLYVRKQDKLEFNIMITKSKGIFKGGRNGPAGLPPMKIAQENVCGYSVIEGRLVNIPDVYANKLFDFSGPRRVDAMLDYKTTSMMVVPMEDDYGEIIGVLQLINALDGDAVIPFDKALENVVHSLASQAAIRMTTMNYAAEIIRLLDSFVEVMSTAIDERSPYNANHSRNMTRYAERFITWLNLNTDWRFDDLHKHQLLMSIWLHDIGKLVIPLEIMDKESRLGIKLVDVEHRLEVFRLANRIRYLSGETDLGTFENTRTELEQALELIRKSNKAGFLPDETLKSILSLGEMEYMDGDGTATPLLTKEELYALSIQRGTLTEDERALMERHVTLTEQMLGKMNFSHNYKMVPFWASSHHEYINGTGYPSKLSSGDIPREVRLITILDIFDALTAVDRPYKPAVPTEKALDILTDMAEREGKLDADILALFKASGAWKKD